MNKLILALLALSFSANSLLAQTPAPPEKNDPQAKKVLDKIRKKYDAYKTLEATFSLAIEVPGQPKDVQKGTVSQEDKKFRLDMPDQIVVSDGTTTWAYQKKANEVQVNNADPNDANAFLTPKDLLNRYQKGDFLYTIADKTTEGGKVLTQIEFKPKDRNSEYSKLRVAIDEKAGTIQSIKAFAKDGSRYTFSITRFSPNKALPAGQFSFDTKQFKGVRVEDLRM
ncbi:MAG: LolA family protein [Saprospiraceae bacterium]